VKATRLLFLDFETYYDDEYSLRKMPTPNYILDPRWETICCAVKEDKGRSHVVDGPDFVDFLANYDPAETTTVTFNSLFDNSILAWRYGFIPHRMIDTMGMARALRGHLLPSASLDSVARHLGLGEKGHALAKVRGLHREDIIAAGLWDEFKDYAIQDVELNAAIFYKLYPEFPLPEQKLMDLVLRCTIEPSFTTDRSMLCDHLAEVKEQKQALLDNAGADKKSLMSTAKFKVALEDLGVKVEMKTSPKGKEIPAFAKSDDFMQELLEHDDDRVQALATARLGFKSTLEETRGLKLLSIASLPWLKAGLLATSMPVPLRYGGAHTHRLSGEWGMNMQNLPTERGSKGKSKLRKSLLAPKGSLVSAADLGQIEARLTAWICGDVDLLKQFADNLDPYAILAELIFGYKVNRKVQILEGFIGKTGVLGLGYGAGVDKFYNMVIIMARAAGIDLKDMWTRELAAKTVAAYRKARRAIVHGWYRLDQIIATAWVGKSGPAKFGPCLISKGRIELPNGLSLNYADPKWDSERQEFTYRYGKRTHHIYGAKMLENIVQALARIVVMNAALRIHDKGYRFVLQGHDELVFILPKDGVDKAKEIIHTEMVRRPSWAPTVPLKADIGAGPSYGDAK
jgi:hypothetical protein